MRATSRLAVEIHRRAARRSQRHSHLPPRSVPSRRWFMRIGLSTSVIQGGKTGIAQYVFALVQALRKFSSQHEFALFVLEKDLPLFECASQNFKLILVPEKFRPPIRNILW